MCKLAVSLLLCVVWTLPAAARDATGSGPNGPTKARQSESTFKQAARTIEKKVRKHLGEAGFRDIQLMPTSFLIQAKDANGKPVLLMIGSDLTGQGEGSASNPSGETDGLGGQTPPARTLEVRSDVIAAK